MIECLHFQDYWNPGSVLETSIGSFRVLIEDFAFAFFFAGASGMLAHFSGRKIKNLRFRFRFPIQLAFIGAASMILSFLIFSQGTNSIIATSLGFLAISGIVSLAKSGTLGYAVRCGLLTAAMMFAVYVVTFNAVSNTEEIFRTIWLIYGDPVLGVRFLAVPLTELAWGFAWGSMAGAVRDLTFE